MNISTNNQVSGDCPTLFDLTDLDYDMMVIVLQGFKKKLVKLGQRKRLLSIAIFETYDMDIRQQFKDQIKFIKDMEDKLKDIINKITQEVGYL